jgi:hypothetical protein
MPTKKYKTKIAIESGETPIKLKSEYTQNNVARQSDTVRVT